MPAQSPTSVVSTTGPVVLHSAPALMRDSTSPSAKIVQPSMIPQVPDTVSSPRPIQTASVDPAIGDPESSLSTSANAQPAVIPDLSIGGVIYSAFGGSPITLTIPSPASLQSSNPLDPASATAGPNDLESGSSEDLSTISTVDGSALTVCPSKVSVGGSMISYSDPGLTLAGISISIGSNGVIFGISTITISTTGEQLSAPQPSPATEDPAIIVDGTTLHPDGPGLLLSNVPITLEGSDILLIGTSTININPLFSPSPPAPHVFTVAGQSFTANPSAFAIDSTSLVAGLAGVTLSGTPSSLATGGSLVIGASTIVLNAPLPTAAAVPSIGSDAFPYTMDSGSHALVIGTQTLTDGGSIAVSGGNVLSLAPGGTAVVLIAPGKATVTEALSGGLEVFTAGTGVDIMALSGAVAHATATGKGRIVFASGGTRRSSGLLGGGI
ncbi:hypothetical protein MMC13_004389 [Lambiella insularis]|nr:hypothetical protein [Lambiella insularis]